MDCRELVELVTEYLEDQLPQAERDRFESHLRGCPFCGRYVEQMRQTIRLTGRLREEDVPAAGQEVLLAAFREWRAAR